MAGADEGAAIHRAFALHRTGRSQDAAMQLAAALRRFPGSAGILRLLAEVQGSMGRRGAEAAALEALTGIEPLNAPLWRRLASLLSDLGRLEDAFRAFERATELDPEEASAWQGRCRAALATQRLSEAGRVAAHITQRFPDQSTSHLLMGHVHKSHGRTEDARSAYAAAIARDPESSEALFNLVDLETPAADDPLAARVETLLERSDVEAERANLAFAAARIQEKAGDVDSAFARYELANAAMSRGLEAQGIRHDPEALDSVVDEVIARYPKAAFAQPLEALPIELEMVFIVGMPRSGTSLVEQILASHARVQGGGELPLAAECERYHREQRRERALSGALDPADERERELLRECRERYVDGLMTLDLDAAVITDKAPGNLARLGFLRAMFPNAAVVHCRRDRVATCWSLFTAHFAQHDPYKHSLDHLAHYHRCYERLMAHWRAVLGPAMTEIQYEQLVTQPEAEIRRLLDALHLEWDESCLQFPANPRAVLTASHSAVRTPIYSTSVDRWKPFASKLGALRR